MQDPKLKELAEELARTFQKASMRQKDGKRIRGILVAYNIKTGEILELGTSFSVVRLQNLGDVKTFTLWEEFSNSSQDKLKYTIDFEGEIDITALSAIAPVIDSFIEIVRKDED